MLGMLRPTLSCPLLWSILRGQSSSLPLRIGAQTAPPAGLAFFFDERVAGLLYFRYQIVGLRKLVNPFFPFPSDPPLFSIIAILLAIVKQSINGYSID